MAIRLTGRRFLFAAAFSALAELWLLPISIAATVDRVPFQPGYPDFCKAALAHMSVCWRQATFAALVALALGAKTTAAEEQMSLKLGEPDFCALSIDDHKRWNSIYAQTILPGRDAAPVLDYINSLKRQNSRTATQQIDYPSGRLTAHYLETTCRISPDQTNILTLIVVEDQAGKIWHTTLDDEPTVIYGMLFTFHVKDQDFSKRRIDFKFEYFQETDSIEALRRLLPVGSSQTDVEKVLTRSGAFRWSYPAKGTPKKWNYMKLMPPLYGALGNVMVYMAIFEFDDEGKLAGITCPDCPN